ncbi:MFS transporter [Streptomyces sp. VRA16 Mangrove soil]|uniref:MFS transporter n=1 Tax=Streptomyces sp. VRA16 Mangrove soil TaxID=2817434 RepID=UPI001A9F0D98|nr:MFS transporter [Streptomyces sp. VRA16 Mangrove soil]MBO1331355.1 MFS transporter [Streptomyces sp. VRA16 Mangrove soil]
MSLGREHVAWAALAAMTVSFGLNFSAGVFFAPAADEYGMNVAALATAAALGTLLTGLVQPSVGVLLDRIGARWVLLGGLTLMSLGYLALSVVQSTWQFIAAFTVFGGLGFAAASSLTISTMLGRIHGDKAGPALARSAVGINLGQLIAPWAATAMFDPVGVRAAYTALGAAGLLVTLVLAVLLPAEQQPRMAQDERGRERLTGRGRMLTSFGLHAATMYGLVLLLPKHAVDLGLSVVDAGRLVVLSAAAAGATSAVVVRLLRRHRPESLLRVLHTLRALSLLLAVLVTDVWGLVAVAVLFGISSFPVVPLTMAVLSRGLDPTRMGRTLAPAWVVHQLSAAAGLGLAVVIHGITGSYRGNWGIGVAMAATAALLVSPLVRRVRASRRQTEALT